MGDFWRMVWEHQCSSIILLCDTNDNDMVYMIWRLAIQSFHEIKGDRNGKSHLLITSQELLSMYGLFYFCMIM